MMSVKKFLQSHHLKYLARDSPDFNPLDYYGGGGSRVEQETNKTVLHQRWTEGKDNGKICQFKLGDH